MSYDGSFFFSILDSLALTFVLPVGFAISKEHNFLYHCSPKLNVPWKISMGLLKPLKQIDGFLWFHQNLFISMWDFTDANAGVTTP